MEKKDYSQFGEISIKDGLPIFFVGNISIGPNDIFDYFDSLGVKTLEDLFVAYDNGCFNDRRKKYNIEIKGQTELLMSIYTNTPLVADGAFNIGIDISTKEKVYRSFEDKTYLKALMRAGISFEECGCLLRYCCLNNDQIVKDINGRTSILDIMSRFSVDKEYQAGLAANAYSQDYIRIIQNIRFKTKFFECYFKNDFLRNEPFDMTVNETVSRSIIESLESQMEFLVHARDNLDIQITELQAQLANVKSVEGMGK